MDFYDATSAKQYARNKTRIIKEINDIEANIAEAVDDNLFECDVYNTVMTDDREVAEPTVEAKAHCIMELSTVNVNNEESDTDDEPVAKEKNYFRVGELMCIENDENIVNPIELRISKVTDNGDIEDFEILNRGEYTEIQDKVKLTYKDIDETNYLDIRKDFGLYGDLQIDREKNVFIKDVTDDSEDNFGWYPIQKTWTLDNLPDVSFGQDGDIYWKNDEEALIYYDGKWHPSADEQLEQKFYSWSSFKMPFNYGEEGLVCLNVPMADKNGHLVYEMWVKTHCGWYKSPYKEIKDLGNRETMPYIETIDTYGVVKFNIVKKDKDGKIISSVPYLMYKCCHDVLLDVKRVVDWKDLPDNQFGNNYDMFVYPYGKLRIKVGGEWIESNRQWRFDDLHIEDDFGEIHDVISYDGRYEPTSTYVKMKNGHWELVNKVWDLDEYRLGFITVNADLTWTVKYVIVDKVGSNYKYPTNAIFSNGNASVRLNIVNDKIVDVYVVYGGDDYTNEVPEINFVMEAPTLSKKYYEVWKRAVVNNELQDEMDQVIDYFENTKTYAISRVSNSDGKTFHWHLQWN